MYLQCGENAYRRLWLKILLWIIHFCSGNFLLNIVIILIIYSLAIFLLKFSHCAVVIEITQLNPRNLKLFKIAAVFILCGFENFFSFKNFVLKKCFTYLLLSNVFLGCLNLPPSTWWQSFIFHKSRSLSEDNSDCKESGNSHWDPESQGSKDHT